MVGSAMAPQHDTRHRDGSRPPALTSPEQRGAAEDVLDLQRAAGNRAVASALANPDAQPLAVQCSFLSWVKGKLKGKPSPPEDAGAPDQARGYNDGAKATTAYSPMPGAPRAYDGAPPAYNAEAGGAYSPMPGAPRAYDGAPPAYNAEAGGVYANEPAQQPALYNSEAGGNDSHANRPAPENAYHGNAGVAGASGPSVIPSVIPSPLPSPPSTAGAGPTSKYAHTLEMNKSYAGEHLSDEDAAKEGQYPHRHAAGIRRSSDQETDKARQSQAQLIPELEEMAKAGLGKTPEYAAKLKSAMSARHDELDSEKSIDNLGLRHELTELDNFKVKYLDTQEARDPYELRADSGIVQGNPPQKFNTSSMFSYGSGKGWAAYVMDPQGKIYAAEHRIQRVHHSSFMAGKTVAAAGEIKVEDGALKGISNKSGHYGPQLENLLQVLDEIVSRGLSLSGVQVRYYEGRGLKDFPGDAAKFHVDKKEELRAKAAGAKP